MGLFNLKGEQSKRIGSSSSHGASPAQSAGQDFGTAPYRPEPSPQAKESASEPPPYHDWTIIPDTAVLPPPPTVGHYASSTSNAERDEANRAHDWCKANPLLFPHEPQSFHTNAVRDGQIGLIRPLEYNGQLSEIGVGSWAGQSKPKMKDALLLTSLPLYFGWTDSPSHTGQKKVIYFEVEIRSMNSGKNNEESSLAVGFCALPQPTWRLPGWERATLGVHSDDGRRYVNNTWGGKDFTAPFKAGDTVGIGMAFSTPSDPPDYGSESAPAQSKREVEVFFTKNGFKSGGWDLHEELDVKDDLPIDGLDGLFDLYGAIGIFGGVDFVAKFKRDEWLWRPH